MKKLKNVVPVPIYIRYPRYCNHPKFISSNGLCYRYGTALYRYLPC